MLSFGFFSHCRFLSTLSLRRATPAKSESLTTYLISIHALLAESDPLRQLQFALCRNFYPRSPCGERLDQMPSSRAFARFLSTLSLRRATSERKPQAPESAYFYPRSPCGERRRFQGKPAQCTAFLSTLSLRRATSSSRVYSRS